MRETGGCLRRVQKAVGIIVDCTQILAHTHSSPLEWFQSTLNHSGVRRVGYWGTNEGKEQIEKAMKILLPYKNNGGIRSFGVEQEGTSKQSTYFGLDSHSNNTMTVDTEENMGNELEEDLACRPAFLTPSRPHIDLEVTSQMASDIKNRWNPQQQFASNHQETYKTIENSEERNLMYMRGLHYLQEDLMAHQREEENSQNQEGDMLSQPTNASGNKVSNARKRRSFEKNKP
jgi:hypothetical protein